MNQKLLIGLTVVALTIAAIIWWQQSQNGDNMSATTEASPSPGIYQTIVEEETLTTQEGVAATVDAEVDRIDAELDTITETDFSTANFNAQLEL